MTGSGEFMAGSPAPVSLAAAARVWWRIGCLGFGGPAGQIALMHRELVEQRRWISEGRYLHALNYCMLLPGPEAQQLAVYIGWLLHRTWGGIIAGALFVLPGAAVLALLSALYVGFGDVPLVSALFYGLKAAVLALVLEAMLRIARRALKTRFLVAVAISGFAVMQLFNLAFPWVVAGAAALGFLLSRLRPQWLPVHRADAAGDDQHYLVDRQLAQDPSRQVRATIGRTLRVLATCLLAWFAPVALLGWWLGGEHVLVQQGLFFSQAAVVTFGGAYAVLAFVAQHTVGALGWLQPGEMLDGLALAETTPGPLVLVLQFVGFVAAYRLPGPLDPWFSALLGAAITSWVTFIPSYLFIFVGAPYVESLRRHRGLHAALSTISAAVVGVILSLALWFAWRTLFAEVGMHDIGPVHLELPAWRTLDPVALLLATMALLALLRWKLGLGWVLAGAAVAGVCARLLPG
jgi:chromate transporter